VQFPMCIVTQSVACAVPAKDSTAINIKLRTARLRAETRRLLFGIRVWADTRASSRCRSRRPQALQALRGLRTYARDTLTRNSQFARRSRTSVGFGPFR